MCVGGGGGGGGVFIMSTSLGFVHTVFMFGIHSGSIVSFCIQSHKSKTQEITGYSVRESYQSVPHTLNLLKPMTMTKAGPTITTTINSIRDGMARIRCSPAKHGMLPS